MPPTADELTAGATSFQDYPLSDRERAWDADAALRRWQDECGIGGDQEDWARFHGGFLWYDGAEPEQVGSHHLQFVDVIDGEATAVWRGIAAAATEPDVIPLNDLDLIRAHLSRYYAKARDGYGDPTLTVPWDETAMTAALAQLERETRREQTWLALTAAGAVEMQTTYDLTHGGLLERSFYTAVLEAGYSEVSGGSWPCEAAIDFASAPVMHREGNTAAVFRLEDRIALVSCDWGWMRVRVASASPATSAGAVEAFRATYPPLYRSQEDDGKVPVTFWTYGEHGPFSRLRMIDAQDWTTIAPNYTAGVRGELDRLVTAFEPGKDGQLLLWQGPPGTGKTWALRALASEWGDWAEFHYITDPDAFFVGKPSYMIDVLLADSYEEIQPTPDGGEDIVTSDREGKWRVLILEDTGELLAANAKDAYGQGLSRLLNVVDGMVGQGLRILCLVTTNDELGDLHPAVKRPGRCASQITFGPLTAQEAAAWMSERDEAWVPADPLPEDTVTIAELFDAAGRAADAIPIEEDDVNDTVTADAIVAIEPPTEADATGLAYHVVLAPEGKATDDGRIFAPGAVSWRPLPLSLMAMTETGPGGHEGAKLAGRIDDIYRVESGRMTLIEGDGMFDSGEYGREIARLVDERTLRGNSVDLAIRSFTVGPRSAYVDEDGYWIAGDPADLAEPTEEEMLDALFDPESIFVILDAVIGMSTVCPFPAFEEGEIGLVASAGPAPMTIRVTGPITIRETGLTASAAGAAPVVPPAEWFDDPQLEEPTPLTVGDDGRVFGHAALWGVCHIGLPGACTTAPLSMTEYAYFHLKEIDALADGETVPVAVGTVTIDAPHAGRTLGREAATAHYDHTGAAAADVRCGEDEHGIWFAGAVRPDLSVEKLRALKGATLSGDWRRVSGNLELVALLAVNVPGFPVPRRPRALVATGDAGTAEVLALVAAGIPLEGPELSPIDVATIETLAAVARGGLGAAARRARGDA